MATKPPLLKLQAGLTIGHSQPLASTKEDIVLGDGTHFLIARNGRGKTTLLRTLAGSLKQVNGGFETTGSIQYLPEDLRFDQELSAKSIFRALLPKCLNEALELAAEVELDVKKPYGKLSTGNRRKTAFIAAELSISPNSGNIILLDEPFSGLDAHARAIFERRWQHASANVLRLVSCHPDYDGMPMPSAVVIQDGHIRHAAGAAQTWNSLKCELN
jgi:ABC-type multidrug transport system ATPase subunit